jgi:hypothetical protein
MSQPNSHRERSQLNVDEMIGSWHPPATAYLCSNPFAKIANPLSVGEKNGAAN